MMEAICTECCHIGRPAKKKRGSDRVASMMWLAFQFGIPYTLWRMGAKRSVCARCGAQTLIPAESTVGQRLLVKHMEYKAPLLAQALKEELAEKQSAIAMILPPHLASSLPLDVVTEMPIPEPIRTRKHPLNPDEW